MYSSHADYHHSGTDDGFICGGYGCDIHYPIGTAMLVVLGGYANNTAGNPIDGHYRGLYYTWSFAIDYHWNGVGTRRLCVLS